MKKIVIVIFDGFTDIDLFLMWDILGRNRTDWQVKILGTKEEHRSAHGLSIKTHGYITEANDADVVLFSSGRTGVKAAIKDETFMKAFSLNPERQIIGSICALEFDSYSRKCLISKMRNFKNATTTARVAVGRSVFSQPGH
ncbi:hypothetical protein EVC37_19105 [Methylocaldum sp. BRCS4]|uniref:DJ-1/PfpI family protein n=1 Tax=Methylocaldum sp. 14B TaxID=1912213 RepID=UPI001180576D|nr:DJ-1/PfpI family protein [Methylocaldum sp. 14B]MVF23702.1 hypothetical protein [Methylocaldum sp. BRCS4]